MTRRSLIRLLGLLLILGISFMIARPAARAQGDPGSEIFQLLNQYRASLGLPPFQYNNVLASAAQRHANWMAANLIFSHTGDGGSSPLSRATDAGYSGYVVENIVGGSSMSPRQGLIWWQNSPIHYNTLVTERYPQAGIGFATDGNTKMYVLVVGRPPGPSEALSRSTAIETTSQPLIITPIQLAEPREDGSIVHIMRTGQAMWTVAAYYDVDLAYLYLINSLSEDAVLHPGDEVTVLLAEGQEPPPTPTPRLNHIIREGESAWSIALQHGISTGYLYQLNDLDEYSVLHPGNELIVRLAEGQPPLPTPTPKTYHTVQSGQSLWAIAAQYNLTLEELIALNELSAQSIILQGDQLLIRPLPPTPLPETPSPPTANPAVSPIAYPPNQGENNPAASPAYPEPATPVSQFAAIVASPTPQFASAAADQSEDGRAANTSLIIFIIAGLLLLAFLLVTIIRELRAKSFLP